MEPKSKIAKDGIRRYRNGKPVIVDDPAERKCSKCQVVKPMSEFYLDGSRAVLRGRGYRCKQCTFEYRREYVRTPRILFDSARRYAKQRSFLFTLSLDEYLALREQRCHYCNGPLPETGIGLDQLIAGAGYTLSNVVPCCLPCNQIKSDIFTADEMRRIGRVVAEIAKERPLVYQRNSRAKRPGPPLKHLTKQALEQMNHR